MIPPLDRMEIEDIGGADPRRLAQAIHRQLGQDKGAVPVREIALGLDIDEIRIENLTSFEGALVTTEERDRGRILLNASAPPQRRRYTLGHELLHFLNPLHRQTVEAGFECRNADMVLGGFLGRQGLSWQERQEVEANRFSIELLAPPSLMRPYLKGVPDIERIPPCATELDISKEAAARRYIELHGAQLALVVTKDRVVLYNDWTTGFPLLLLQKNDPLPAMRPPAEGDVASTMEEVDPAAWLKQPRGEVLFAQTLFQSKGHAMTLLHVERKEADRDSLVDTYESLLAPKPTQACN